MTQAPYLLPGARAGYRLGDQSVVDSMMYDGLSAPSTTARWACPPSATTTGASSRARQDEFAARSHQLAAAAIAAGRFAEEIVTVAVPQRKGDPLAVAPTRACAPSTTAESLAALRPAFDPAGTVTAGNASQISDGGAAVLVMSAERAEALGLDPIGEILGYGQVAGPDASLLTQPSNAIRQAAQRAGLEPDAMDLYEINEAFAAVGLASMDDLGLDEAKVNVNGGAIALGHPIGMSGTRLAITALRRAAPARRRRGRGRPVRRRRPGRRGDPAVPLDLRDELGDHLVALSPTGRSSGSVEHVGRARRGSGRGAAFRAGARRWRTPARAPWGCGPRRAATSSPGRSAARSISRSSPVTSRRPL